MADTRLPDLAGVYRDYHPRVVAYATRLLGRDEADDVAQEVFLKIDRSLDTLADEAKLGAWIYAITLNTVRDLLRKRSERERTAAGLGRAVCDPAPAAPLDEVPDTRSRRPDEVIERNEMVACYVGYVEQLPRDYYDVYVLSEFEDLPDGEIARRLSLSLATVKIRLHRARARLHDALRRNCRCYHNERGEIMGGRRP